MTSVRPLAAALSALLGCVRLAISGLYQKAVETANKMESGSKTIQKLKFFRQQFSGSKQLACTVTGRVGLCGSPNSPLVALCAPRQRSAPLGDGTGCAPLYVAAFLAVPLGNVQHLWLVCSPLGTAERLVESSLYAVALSAMIL